MKKKITIISAILLAGATVFTSCKKDDVTAPVVTINGGDQTVSLQGSFTDLGATANDNKDGDMSTSVSGVVDVNHTGVYMLTYTATDAAGNEGTATRNVTVVNDLESMSGTYTCVLNPGGYSYTQTIKASTTRNRRINFGLFGDYDNNIGIYADVLTNSTTSPIDLPFQTGIQVGNASTGVSNRDFLGTSGSRISANSFSLGYNETSGGTTTPYTEVYTK